MKRTFITICIFIFSLFFSAANAQQKDASSAASYKIAIFAPLYLDSLFSNNYYKYEKKFPRFVLPGLDFVLGAQIAIDTLSITESKLQAHIYDSKSSSKKISSLIESHELDNVSLLIGSVKDEEYMQLANFARQKNIPFISATYPNDGGIIDNPNLFIINSTLKTHCEAIFAYLLQNHSSDNLIHTRKKGNQEDRISGYFNNINQPDGNTLLNVRTILIDSNFNLVLSKLDSTRKNIIIGGSLDEQFCTDLAEALNSVKKKYDITLIGMPNWDGFRFKKNFDYSFYYTSPYYKDENNFFSKFVDGAYLKKYKKPPSDFACKGFEAVFTTVSLLIKHHKAFGKNINDISFDVFSKYNFVPIKGEKKDIPNYYENKHLFILKKSNGTVSRVL